MTTEQLNRQAKVLAFVREHGFRARANAGGSVTLWIPYTAQNGTVCGEEDHTVKTIAEARIALGY